MTFIDELINKKFNTNKGYLYFVDLIKEKYPTFHINEENLKNLTITEMSQETFNRTGFVGVYYAKRNKIELLKQIDYLDYTFSEDELLETFLHELIHALTSKIVDGMVFEGLNQRIIENNLNSYFLAINEGITQFIVNDLLGKKSDAYPFESNIANQLAIIIGKDKLISQYSRNDIEGFINTLKGIDPDFNINNFIKIISAISLVLKGELKLGNDLSDKTIVTEIQKQLLALYLNASVNKDSAFLEAMLDSRQAEEIIKQCAIKENQPNIKADDIGFKGLDEIKLNYATKIKEEEEKNMDYVVYENKKEELLAYAKESADEMVRIIQSGQVINDVIDDEGERTIVTLTERGTYGYQVFKAGSNLPHYYAEGFSLIDDLTKYTDSEGRTLRFNSAKSRVQRNLVGIFTEYILDRGFHSFYISQKCEKDSKIQVSQRMAGYDRQDPVTLFSAQFDRSELSIAADAQIIETEDNHTIRIGVSEIHEDGTLNHDLRYKMALESEIAKKMFGESYMSDERLAEVMEQSTRDAQSLLYNVYKTLGLPMLEGVEPNNLLMEQAMVLLPDLAENTDKLS